MTKRKARIHKSAQSAILSRLDYWRSKDLRNGWTAKVSGACCDKCRMTNPKDPLQDLVGCRDPFQINCDCHIQTRRAVRDYIVLELENVLMNTDMQQPIND